VNKHKAEFFLASVKVWLRSLGCLDRAWQGDAHKQLAHCEMNMPVTAADRSWTEAMLRFKFAGQVTLGVALVGWIAWFWPLNDLVDRSGTPLGGDYVMLYVAGQVVADGQADKLYDDALNQQRSSRLFPGMDARESWPFRYPPTVATAMVPLSQLPLASSYGLFLCLQLGLLALSLRWIYLNFSILQQRSGWLWAIVGSPLVLESLIGGQVSLLALACLTGFIHFWKRDRHALAGCLLALTLYKPNVAAMLVLAALVVRPRMLVGFVPTAVVGLLIALATTGWSGIMEYVGLATQLASSAWSLETPYWKVHGLAPWFQGCFHSHGKLICGLVGLISSLTIALCWRARTVPDTVACALLLCGNALFNPYVPIYDLVLLELALILVCQAAYEGRWQMATPLALQALGLLLFVGPHLSQAVARPLGWQPFPWLLLAVVACALGHYGVHRLIHRLPSPAAD
jgi:hypothetical protein